MANYAHVTFADQGSDAYERGGRHAGTDRWSWRWSIFNNIAESATKELAGKPRNHRNIDRVGSWRSTPTSHQPLGAWRIRVSVLAEQDLGGAARQCRSKFGRGVPRTAIAPTTRSQNGSIPKPGTASRASPGNSSHCRPSTRNSNSAVPRSTTHTIGGKGVAKAPMAGPEMQ